ncbi:MAG: hypothetical protein ABIH68_00185 [bacterium]
MMDIEKFYLRLSEYIDRKFEEEMENAFAGFDNFFARDIFDGMEDFFNADIFEEMDDMIRKDSCCSTLFNTLCKTIDLCHEIDEMEVPEDVHENLFRILDIKIED